MAMTGFSPNPQSYGLLILLISSTGIYTSSALDYATNLTVSSKTANTATLGWTAAASGGTASSYIVSLLYGSDVIENNTITTVATSTHTVTGLTYSTFYTVQLYTYDSTGQSTGSASVTFWTKYTTWNSKFIAALAVIGFIIITLLTMMILKSKCLPADPKPIVMGVETKLVDENDINENEQVNEEGKTEKKEKPKSPINIAIF